MSFRKNLFKNIVILGGYNYSGQILSFLSSIVLSRLLLPEEYGFVALITVFTGFISTFSDAGLSYLIIRSDYGRTFHKTIHFLSFIIGVILFVLVVLLAYPISLFYKNEALILPTMVMALTFILRSLITVPYGILSKNLKFNSLGSLELICTTSEIVLMILFAYLGFSYWALILPVIAGNLLRIIMYYHKTHIKFKVVRMNYLKVGFRKAKSIIGNLSGFTFLNYWARNTDNLIIGKFYGADSLGIYNRAYRLLNMITRIMTGIFGKVLYPSLKDLSNKGGDVNKEYINLLGVISLLNYPIAMLLIFFAEPLVRILWSERWIAVAELLPYIGVLILTQTLNSTTGNIYILLGKEKTLMRIGIPTSLIIILSIALGAIFSYVHILRFYTIAIVCFDIPINIYYGFKKSFHFSNRDIIRFWIPKVLLSIMMVVTIWISYKWGTIILAILYLIHLVFLQKEDIVKFIDLFVKVVKSKFKKTN
jgi:O-antigen/teichoic acid export membrane protein